MGRIRNRLIAVAVAVILGVGSVPFGVRAEETVDTVSVTEVSSDTSEDITAVSENIVWERDTTECTIEDVKTDVLNQTTEMEEGKSVKSDVNSQSEDEAELETEELESETEAVNNVQLNSTNFPDENFRNYLTETFDTDGDGWIDANSVKTIGIEIADDDISYYKVKVSRGETAIDPRIYSLEGIELFTNLETLWGHNISVSSLDMSKNKALKSLWFACDIGLISIDVSQNTELENFLSIRVV